MSLIETDYLVIGAGAIGMAFVDTLLTDSDAQIVMVDRHHRPGGHWNESYPFVRRTSLRPTTASIRASWARARRTRWA